MEDLNALRETIREDVKVLFSGLTDDSTNRVAEIMLGFVLVNAENGEVPEAKKFFGTVMARVSDGVKKGYAWAEEIQKTYIADLRELLTKAENVEADPVPVFMTTYQLDRRAARTLVAMARTAGDDEDSSTDDEDTAVDENATVPTQINAEGPVAAYSS